MFPLYPFFGTGFFDENRDFFSFPDGLTTIILSLDDDEHECVPDIRRSRPCNKACSTTRDKQRPENSASKTGLRNMLFDGRETIAFWNDGTKTVAIRCKGEADDPEKGVMAAMLKHYIGDDLSLADEIRHWVKVGKQSAARKAARRSKERK